MWSAIVLLALTQTQIIDDPFEASIIYVTRIDGPKDKGTAVYADQNQCSFLQVSDRSFASSKKRGAREASSFLEFKLTALYKKQCGSPLNEVDISQARYFSALEADVDTRTISSSCAISVCKDEYSVSVRLTSGLASINDEVIIKFGAPHSASFMVSFPIKAYLNHRADVVR